MFDETDIVITRFDFGLDDMLPDDLEAMLAVHTGRKAEGSMRLAAAIRKQLDLHMRFQARNIAMLQISQELLDRAVGEPTT